MKKIESLFRKETVLKSVGIVFIFHVFFQVAGLAKGIIFARLLGPKDYGIFTLAFFFISIIVAIAIIGIPSSYNRYIPQYEQKGMVKEFVKKTYSLTIIMAIVVSLFCILFSKQLSKLLYGFPDYNKIMILGGLTILPLVLFRNLLATFSGIRVFKMQSLLSLVQVCFFTVLGIGFVVFHANRAESVMLGNLLSYVFVTILFGFLFWKYLLNNKTQDTKISESGFYHKILKFSGWYVLTPLAMILFRYTDRWMLNRFLSLSDVGIYSAAGTITQFTFAMGAIAGGVLAPNLASAWERGEKQNTINMINFAIKTAALFLLGCSVVFALFKEQIIFALYGHKYMAGISTINIFLIFYIFNTVWLIVAIYSDLVEKTYLHFIAISVGLVINLILNYKLIPSFGIIGAITATTISCGIMLVILCIFNKLQRMKIELKTIFVLTLPLILLLNNSIMIMSYIMLILVALKTNLFFTREQKNKLVRVFLKPFKRGTQRGE